MGVETSPGAGEGDAPRQADEPAGRREQLAQGGGGQHFAGPAPGEREASEWRLRGRGAGDRAAAQEPEAQDQEMGDGEGAAESGAVPQMEGVSVGEAAAIRARTARIRAELAEILESQGGALVFTGGAAGGGLRIGVRPGGFNTAGAGGRGFARAAATGEGGARPLHETFHHGRGVNRDPITGRSGRGRGFTSAREAVQRAPGPIDPRERAARMFAELDVIFAGSTPAGRRSNRSRRRVFETTLEDYGFVVERGRQALRATPVTSCSPT